MDYLLLCNKPAQTWWLKMTTVDLVYNSVGQQLGPGDSTSLVGLPHASVIKRQPCPRGLADHGVSHLGAAVRPPPIIGQARQRGLVPVWAPGCQRERGSSAPWSLGWKGHKWLFLQSPLKASEEASPDAEGGEGYTFWWEERRSRLGEWEGFREGWGIVVICAIHHIG